MANSKKSMYAGIGALALLTMSSKLVRLIVLMVTARFVTPEGFGVVASFTMILAVTYLVAGMGIVRTLIQRPSLSEFHIGSALYISITTSLIVFISLYFYGYIYEDITGIPGLKEPLKAASLLFLLLPFTNTSSAIFQRNGEAVLIGKIQAGCTVFGSLFITIPMLWFDFGFWSIITGVIITDITGQLIILYIGRSAISLKVNIKCLSEILQYSTLFLFNNLIEITSKQIDIAIVGKFLGANLLGNYSRAMQLIEFPSQMYFLVVDRVVFPIMTSMMHQKEKLSDFFLNTLSTLLQGLSICILILFFGAEHIILIMMGEQWTKIPPLLQILSISILFKCITRFMDSYLSALDKVKIMTFKQTAFLPILCCCIWLGLDFGVNGVAMGLTFALGIRFLATAIIIIHVTSISFKQCIFCLRPTLISVFAITSLYFMLTIISGNQGLLLITISTLLWLIVCFRFPTVYLISLDGYNFILRAKSKIRY